MRCDVRCATLQAGQPQGARSEPSEQLTTGQHTAIESANSEADFKNPDCRQQSRAEPCKHAQQHTQCAQQQPATSPFPFRIRSSLRSRFPLLAWPALGLILLWVDVCSWAALPVAKNSSKLRALQNAAKCVITTQAPTCSPSQPWLPSRLLSVLQRARVRQPRAHSNRILSRSRSPRGPHRSSSPPGHQPPWPKSCGGELAFLALFAKE